MNESPDFRVVTAMTLTCERIFFVLLQMLGGLLKHTSPSSGSSASSASPEQNSDVQTSLSAIPRGHLLVGSKDQLRLLAPVGGLSNHCKAPALVVAAAAPRPPSSLSEEDDGGGGGRGGRVRKKRKKKDKREREEGGDQASVKSAKEAPVTTVLPNKVTIL